MIDWKDVPNKMDTAIRFFLYVFIFWLPYSPAVVEICIITAFMLWLIKRAVCLFTDKPLSARKMMDAFIPPPGPLNQPIYYFLFVCIISVSFSAFWQQSLHNFITKTFEWFVVYFLFVDHTVNINRLLSGTLFLICALRCS